MCSPFPVFLFTGGRGWVKIEICSECDGKSKNALKFYSFYTLFDQVGVGCLQKIWPGKVWQILQNVDRSPLSLLVTPVFYKPLMAQTLLYL